MENYTDIFNYITTQESLYKQPIQMNESWRWSMMEHIKLTELYNNSQLKNGKNEFTPVKNITRPILNLQHRTEDIDVKDVEIYVDDPSRYHLSFLVKKYHDDIFVQENDLDTFFDELNVSRIDMGGGLSKMRGLPCPEVVPLQSIAFCDQTDMLSAPIGIKHFYSADQLIDMGAKGWGDTSNGATISIADLLTQLQEERTTVEGQVNKTPGRYAEIYEVHGNLPRKFADPTDDSGVYETRIYIVGFYNNKANTGKTGVILYTQPEPANVFKLIKRDPVYGRALGFGGGEELFEPQVWTNYDMIRMQDMLDAASKTILKYTGPGLANRTKIKEMENLDIIELQPGDDLEQLNTFPNNLKLFQDSLAAWQQHAQDMGGASDILQGEEPASGTPFASLQAQVQQGLGLHEYRRGQYAKHLEEIYKDWIIPYIEKQILKGFTFLSELSLEQLQYVTEAIVTNEANKQAVNMVLAGQQPTPDQINIFKDLVRTQFKKKGSKHFVEILAKEFKGIKFSVKVSVAGKSANLSKMADNMTNIFRQIFANPQQFAMTMQIPAAATAFNELLEYSGLTPMDFNDFGKLAATAPTTPAPPSQQQPQLPPAPTPQPMPAAQ